MKRMFAPLLQIEFIWKLTKSAKTLKKYQQYARNLFLQVGHRDTKKFALCKSLVKNISFFR